MGDSRVYNVLLSFGVSGLGEVALWKDKPKYVTMNKEEGKNQHKPVRSGFCLPFQKGAMSIHLQVCGKGELVVKWIKN